MFLNLRKRKGSEIEGAVELRMSLYHRKTHFLKYVSTVNQTKAQMSMLKTLSLRSHDAFRKHDTLQTWEAFIYCCCKHRGALPPLLPVVRCILIAASRSRWRAHPVL